MKNIANILTITRLLLLPFIVALFYVDRPWAYWTLLGLYIVGAVTDYLDGWAARRWNQVSEFGKFMDPISDKVFIVTLLIMLIHTQRIAGGMVIAVVVILVREFLVSGMREFLGARDIKLPVTTLAKWKTTVQMVATGMLIVADLSPWLYEGGNILLCIAAILTVVTGWTYLRAGLRHII